MPVVLGCIIDLIVLLVHLYFLYIHVQSPPDTRCSLAGGTGEWTGPEFLTGGVLVCNLQVYSFTFIIGIMATCAFKMLVNCCIQLTHNTLSCNSTTVYLYKYIVVTY